MVFKNFIRAKEFFAAELEVHADTSANDGVVASVVSPCVTCVSEDTEAIFQTDVETCTEVRCAFSHAIGVDAATREDVGSQAKACDWEAENCACVERVDGAVSEAPSRITFDTQVLGEEVSGGETCAHGVVQVGTTNEACGVETEDAAWFEAVTSWCWWWWDWSLAHWSFSCWTSEAESGHCDCCE